MHEAILKITEWQGNGDQTIYLCDADQIPVSEQETRRRYNEFHFTAYVLWEQINGLVFGGQLLHQLGDDTIFAALEAQLDEELSRHFDERQAQKRRELVDDWKRQKLYPYTSDPSSEADRIERATFDVVATSIRKFIPRQRQSGGLMLTLLRDALRSRPDEITQILNEVLRLPAKDVDQMAQLLDRTGLSNVIKAGSTIANRLDFLAALDRMVHDPETSNLVKERLHLHKILERELWVFGEEYNMMTSERTLSTVLDHHLSLLGRTRADAKPVTRLDGRSGRVDLLMSAAATEYDRNRHLVVELKAPDVDATHVELKQVKDYAKAVAADPRFADVETVWDFWLVVRDLDDEVREECNQEGRPRGIAYAPKQEKESQARVRVWVKSWGEILDEAARRLEVHKKNLNHDPSTEHAIEYLRREHWDVIPDELRGEAAEVS